METSGGILSRLGEKAAGWIMLALLILIGVAIYRMDAVLKTAIWQGAWRTLLWIGIAAATPWSTRFFVRRVLDLGSNWAGVALLAAFLVVDLGAGLLLLSGCDATIQAKRQAVVAEGSGEVAPAVPTAIPNPDVTGVVREKLAQVAEDAADVAKNAAERLRGKGDSQTGEAETKAGDSGTPLAENEQSGGHGGWFWFACVAALALAGTYNYLVTEYLSEMAGG